MVIIFKIMLGMQLVVVLVVVEAMEELFVGVIMDLWEVQTLNVTTALQTTVIFVHTVSIVEQAVTIPSTVLI